MLKLNPITAFMKMHANFQKIILIRVFSFKYIFPIKYKIPILDLMTVFHLKGYNTVACEIDNVRNYLLTRNVSMGHRCPRYSQIRINRELSLTKGTNS